MTTYATPMGGTYNYRTRNFNGSFNLFQIPCLVLGETAASYIISTLRELCGEYNEDNTAERTRAMHIRIRALLLGGTIAQKGGGQ